MNSSLCVKTGYNIEYIISINNVLQNTAYIRHINIKYSMSIHRVSLNTSELSCLRRVACKTENLAHFLACWYTRMKSSEWAERGHAKFCLFCISTKNVSLMQQLYDTKKQKRHTASDHRHTLNTTRWHSWALTRLNWIMWPFKTAHPADIMHIFNFGLPSDYKMRQGN